MRIKNFLKVTVLLSIVFALQSMTVVKGVEGIWEYEAPDAPYEYSEGKIIIKKTDGKYTAEIKLEYESIDVEDVKVDKSKNTVVMKFDIDGTPIRVIMNIKGDVFKGVSETPNGDIALTGKRKIDPSK